MMAAVPPGCHVSWAIPPRVADCKCKMPIDLAHKAPLPCASGYIHGEKVHGAQSARVSADLRHGGGLRPAPAGAAVAGRVRLSPLWPRRGLVHSDAPGLGLQGLP